MQADINTAKSRAFNCLLRYLHYAILLFLTDRINSTTLEACSDTGKSTISLFSYLAIALMVLGLISVCYVHNRSKFPRVEFFVSLAVSFILSLVVVILSFTSMNAQSNECMQTVLVQKWGIFTSGRVFVECLLILGCNLFWVQRYTNCPGNLSWAYMFLTINWDSVGGASKNILLAIGVTYFIVSIITFLVHTGTILQGVTGTYKKIIKFWWIFALVIMVAYEILALAGFISGNFSSQFHNVAASRLYQMFLAGNIVDILFWLWGLLTLSYENGDLIRDSLVDLNQEVDGNADLSLRNTQPPVQYYSSFPANPNDPNRNSVTSNVQRFNQQAPPLGGNSAAPASRNTITNMGTILK